MKICNWISTLLLLVVVSISACKKENSPNECGGGEGDGFEVCQNQVDLGIEEGITFAAGGKKLNVYKMVDSISATLKNRVVGYQIAVCYNGQVVAAQAWGYAKRVPDCPVLMDDCSKFNIASQSKTITTAALLQLLDANNLTVDSAIAPYLPSGWAVSGYMSRLRFRHFISHRTAFPGTNSATPSTSNWNACKTFVESTPQPAVCPNPNNPDQNAFDYRNCNLAIMRIIIPALWRKLPTAPAELKNAPAITDALCQKYYEQYVQQYVLTPAGVSASLKQSSPGDVLFYDWTSTDAGDDYFTDWTLHGGGGGWVMNAAKLARTMYAIGYNDAVCTPANRAIMQSHPTLGWRGGFTNTANTTQGLAFGHGGDLNSQGGEMHGNYAILPNGITVSVMINSDDPDGGQGNDLFNYIINAFEGAIE